MNNIAFRTNAGKETGLGHLTRCIALANEIIEKGTNCIFVLDFIEDGIVDDAYLWVKYENDFHGSYWVSKTALGYRNGLQLRLFGDQGSAEWVQEEPERLHISGKNSTRVTYDRGNCTYPDEIRERFKPGHPGGFVEAFGNLYSDIADALEEYRVKGYYNSPYVYGWDHANEGLKLLHAASISNQTKNWTSLETV